MPPGGISYHTGSMVILCLFILHPRDEDRDGAARDDHKAGGAGERRHQHEEDAHDEQRPDGSPHVLAVILVGHGTEEGRHDLVEGRLQHRILPFSPSLYTVAPCAGFVVLVLN